MKTFFKVLFTFVIILTVFLLIFVMLRILYPLKHFDIVKEEAAKNGLDPYLVMAIIKNESGFNSNAISNKEAKGLMQIIDSTASDVNNKINVSENVKNDIYDEKINIALGCKYLSSLIQKYNGNYYIAICAYNAGMGNVDKWISEGIIDSNLNTHKNTNIPFKETNKYLDKVISTYKIYKILYK